LTSARLPLTTDSLLLRHFVPQDAAALLALSNEESARTWLPSQVYSDHAHAASVLAHLIRQYRSPADPRAGAYVLGVEHRAERGLIGHVGFSPFGGSVEIGFALAQAYQRQGYATEAIGAAVRWAFARFGLRKIIAVTSPANTASLGTLLRAGFAHQEDKVLRFQGTAQAVSIYELRASAADGGAT
jgi:RimJ/RimL family protein N-acetyltransferase